MWNVLRTELAYSRWWLLGGLGLALGVATIVTLVFMSVGDEGPPAHAAAGIRAMFIVMAPMIVGFIIQTERAQERRARLLLTGPVTPRHLAAAAVVLPVVLLGVGMAAAGLMLGAESMVTGRFEREAVHVALYPGGLILMMQMMGLVAQEAVAAHQQGRARPALAGWAVFALGVLFLTALSSSAIIVQGPRTWFVLHLGNLIVALVAAVAAWTLYPRRTDFTR